MEIRDMLFEKVVVIKSFHAGDQRGGFTKIYNSEELRKMGISMNIEEVYYSASSENVIRGLHFQVPPYATDKIVHVIEGKVLDVIVDLRSKSETYGKATGIELSADKSEAIYIPEGFAHGFRSLNSHTVMLYLTSKGYQGDCDTGILYSSIDFDWGIDCPIVSERDSKFMTLEKFKTPF